MSDHFQDCTAHAARRTIAVRRGFTLIETLVVASVTAIAMMVAVPALQQSRQQASHVVCKNRLKHIGLAMHNYHDTYRTLPMAGSNNSEYRVEQSWRVRLLPFVDNVELFKQFDFKTI